MANAIEQQKDDYGVPAGYQPALLFSDSTHALMCENCGANVARRNAELHSNWHQALWERLGGI